jgi:hypothetical protein
MGRFFHALSLSQIFPYVNRSLDVPSLLLLRVEKTGSHKLKPEQKTRLKHFYARKAFERALQGEPGLVLEVYRRVHGILPQQHRESLLEIRKREARQETSNLLSLINPSSQIH